MLRLLSRTITVVALCLAIGLQWFALQSIAWTAMMIQNAKQVSFCKAVEHTFDGTRPCSLCHIVNKGQTSQKKQNTQTSVAKIDITCVVRPFRLLPRLVPFDYLPFIASAFEIEHSPLSPPPRATPI